MDKKDKTKEKTYVCVVCSKKKRAEKRPQCCGKDMLSEEKGTLND